MTDALTEIETRLVDWVRQQRQSQLDGIQIKQRCRSLDDAGVLDGRWTAVSGIAMARTLMRPRHPECLGIDDHGREIPAWTPDGVLASLCKVCEVPDRDKAMQAIKHEISTMSRVATEVGRYGQRAAALERIQQERRDARRAASG